MNNMILKILLRFNPNVIQTLTAFLFINTLWNVSNICSAQCIGCSELNSDIIKIHIGCHPSDCPTQLCKDIFGDELEACVLYTPPKHICTDFNRSLIFTGRFCNTCDYDFHIGNTGQQLAWNKLMKISSFNDQPPIGGESFNSIRLGWRWDVIQHKMELGLYGHINHISDNKVGREFVSLGTSVYLGEDFQAVLILSELGLFARVKENAIAIKRIIPFTPELDQTAIRRNAYFGGDQTAPEEIEILVSGIVADCFPTTWKNAPNKSFCNSVFYTGEHFTITASNSITGSLRAEATSTQNKPFDPPFCVVESGADITFVAGNQIKLLPGFHAKAGSKFHAYIGTASYIFPFGPAGSGSDSVLVIDNFDPGNPSGFTQIDSIENPVSDIIQENQASVKENKLTEPFPNPFTESTLIQYSLKDASPVSLNVYNIFGQQVATLVSHPNQEAGVYQVTFNAGNLPSGIYFYTLRAGSFMETKKMVLMK